MDSFSIDRFDDSLGTLARVDIRACFVLDADISITNESANDCTFSIQYAMNGRMALDGDNPPVPPALELDVINLFFPVTMNSTSIGPGETYTGFSTERAFCTECPPSTQICTGVPCELQPYPASYVDPLILDWFTDGPGDGDNGPLKFDLVDIPELLVTITGCATFSQSVQIRLGATIEVEYIYCPNEAPVCAEDTGYEVCATLAGQPADCVDIPILQNDFDPDGSIDCSTLEIVTPPPGGGAVVMGPDCDARCDSGASPPAGCFIRYCPPVGTTGCVTFTYRVADDEGCYTEPCVVEVCVQRRPEAVDDCIRTCDGADFVDIPVLSNDLAPDVPAGSCGCVPSTIDCSSLTITQQPAVGSAVVLNCSSGQGGCADCVIRYFLEPGECGYEAEIEYEFSSNFGCLSGEGTARVVVGCGPIANDDSYELPEDVAFLNLNVLANDVAPADGGMVDCSSLCISDCEGSCRPGPGPFPTLQGGTVQVMGCAGTDCLDQPDPPPPLTCFVRYTPPANGLIGNDAFCYRICRLGDPPGDCPDGGEVECCSEATVIIEAECPTYDRRKPSALLVYPEFDNRNGAVTILTVTNTHSTKSVEAHFEYVDKDECGRFDRELCLTPRDTFTYITNFHNPNHDQGYLYLYAQCCPSGKPIAFNYLIGHQLVVDGILSISYSVNPIAFCAPNAGGPNDPQCPTFRLTDDDMDGIRDLDGIEYEMAPDQILIPRFFGQDGPDGISSHIVLIALSGGRQFTTTVDFWIYNDNEELFSGERTFDCWWKGPLTSLSQSTRNSFLQMSTNHDPEEILGNEMQESGWIRMDGDTASSPSTVIDDPAFYAVLIECVDVDRCVADLPFELCSQPNGDLLPIGNEGDPVQ